MNFLDYKDPEGSLSQALRTTMPQIAGTIAQQLAQRRQQQNNAFGLQGLGMDPQKAQLLSGLSPEILASIAKEELKQPMYEAYGNMFSGGQQPANEQVSPTQVSQAQGQAQPLNEVQPSIRRVAPGTKLTPDMARMIQQENMVDKKIAETRRTNDIKDRKEWRKEIDKLRDQDQRLKETLHHINNVERYWDSGQVIGGATKKWLDMAGLGEAITTTPTQAAVKDMYNILIDTIGSAKGFRGQNFLAGLMQKAKPSEYNTKEGVKPILGGMKELSKFAVKVGDLRRKEWNRLAQNPSQAPADRDMYIQDKIDKLDQETEENMIKISNKAIGYTANKPKIVTAKRNPTTYNTFKDRIFYPDGKGGFVGSDGTRERPLKVVDKIPVSFADEV